MMQRLTLGTLRAAGLPLDWMTVYVGWTNAPNVEIALSVSNDDVRYLAVDALADCDPNDENALFRIADDTSVLRTDLGDYLRQFAEKSGVSETTALRKWRYIYSSGWLEELTKRAAHIASLPKNTQPPAWDDFMETVWEIGCQMQEWNLSPEPPKLYTGTHTETTEKFDRLREWLTQEKAELMTYQNRHNEVPALL